MKITDLYMDETIRAIGYITRDNYNALITVKKVRDFYEIDQLDYSKISFYWRSLQHLEEDGVLRRLGSKTPKKYRVLNYFKFFELLHDAYISNALRVKGIS